MKQTHLVPRKSGNTYFFHFRNRIPKDLIQYFGGRRQFQISLKDVSSKETLLVSITLKQILKEIFQDIRDGMKELTLDDIKEILRIEVRKSILHSGHVSSGHKEIYDSMKKIESLENVYSREINMRKSLVNEPKEIRESVDKKLKSILESLGIEAKKDSSNYRKLRSTFIDLYLLRFKWIKDLMDESGRNEEDFKREVDEKLKMNLFPELEVPPSVQIQVGDQTLNPVIENLAPEPPQPYRVERPQNSLKSTPISKVINEFLSEKIDFELRSKSERDLKHSLGLLLEDFGDIPVGDLDIEKGTLFKSHIKNLPKNRKKYPELRDLSFHEVIQPNKKFERISTVTFNKHIGNLSSFMNWSVTHGYSYVNPFKGMKLRIKKHQREERDRFTEKDLKEIFNKGNFIHFTKVESGSHFHNYFVPLIGVFTGMRLNEICSLYLDNIIQKSGNHREKRWCFNISEEKHRPDKKLKTQSSRRIIPIHDTLIDLGLIELVELLKKRQVGRDRLFRELKYGENGYIRNITYFFGQYLKKLGIKSEDRKLDFHSFRHTLIDHLKQKGIDISFINEYVGHKQGNIDLDRYGKGYNPDILYNKCVSKIVFETSHTRLIDFKILRMNWDKIVPEKDWTGLV